MKRNDFSRMYRWNHMVNTKYHSLSVKQRLHLPNQWQSLRKILWDLVEPVHGVHGLFISRHFISLSIRSLSIILARFNFQISEPDDSSLSPFFRAASSPTKSDTNPTWNSTGVAIILVNKRLKRSEAWKLKWSFGSCEFFAKNDQTLFRRKF